MKFVDVRLEGLGDVAEAIIQASGENRILTFYGEMGAGKTTLILKLIEKLGSTDSGSSPTFSLVNEYRGADDQEIYHFDFYRVESEEEILDMGYEEYFFSGSYCLVEWPEKMGYLLPDDAVKIEIKQDNLGRTIDLTIPS